LSRSHLTGAQRLQHLLDERPHKGVVLDDKEANSFQVFARHGPLNPSNQTVTMWYGKPR
jgi:hypothetical protein